MKRNLLQLKQCCSKSLQLSMCDLFVATLFWSGSIYIYKYKNIYLCVLRIICSVDLNDEKWTWSIQSTEHQHNNDYNYTSQYLTLMNGKNKGNVRNVDPCCHSPPWPLRQEKKQNKNTFLKIQYHFRAKDVFKNTAWNNLDQSHLSS